MINDEKKLFIRREYFNILLSPGAPGSSFTGPTLQSHFHKHRIHDARTQHNKYIVRCYLIQRSDKSRSTWKWAKYSAADISLDLYSNIKIIILAVGWVILLLFSLLFVKLSQFVSLIFSCLVDVTTLMILTE